MIQFRPIKIQSNERKKTKRTFQPPPPSEQILSPTTKKNLNKDDVEKRKHWDAYVEAFQDMLDRTSTEAAPWHVVPADNKWFRNLLVSQVTRSVLEEMDPQLPAPEKGIDKIKIV